MSKDNQILEEFTNSDYKYGFESKIESDSAPKGLNEDIIRFISAKKEEPAWMLEWRLDAYRRWTRMDEPDWAMVNYPPVDYQEQYFYAKPKSMTERPKSLDEVDPKLLETYEKLGIPLKEQEMLAGVAVDAGDVLGRGGGDAPARDVALLAGLWGYRASNGSASGSVCRRCAR